MSTEFYSTSPAMAGGLGAIALAALTHTKAATIAEFPTVVVIGLAVAFGIILLGFVLTCGISPDVLVGMLVVPAAILLFIAAAIFAFGPFWWGAIAVVVFLAGITVAAIIKKRSMRGVIESGRGE